MASGPKRSNPIPPQMNPRHRLLAQAMEITSNDRNKNYGNPEDNFRNIAVYWSQHLSASTGMEITVTANDVAQMMVLMKMARLSTNPTHYDSWLDVAGYAACGVDCVAAEQNKIRGAMSGSEGAAQSSVR